VREHSPVEALRLGGFAGLLALAVGCAGGAPPPQPAEHLAPLDVRRFDQVWVDPAHPGESWRAVTLRVSEIRLAWNLAAERGSYQVNRRRQAQALFDAWSELLRAVFAEPGCVQVIAEPRAQSLEVVLALRDVELAGPSTPARGLGAGFSGSRVHLVADAYDAESRNQVAHFEERRTLSPGFATRSSDTRLLRGLFQLSQDLRAQFEDLCIPVPQNAESSESSGDGEGGGASR